MKAPLHSCFTVASSNGKWGGVTLQNGEVTFCSLYNLIASSQTDFLIGSQVEWDFEEGILKEETIICIWGNNNVWLERHGCGMLHQLISVNQLY